MDVQSQTQASVIRHYIPELQLLLFSRPPSISVSSWWPPVKMGSHHSSLKDREWKVALSDAGLSHWGDFQCYQNCTLRLKVCGKCGFCPTAKVWQSIAEAACFFLEVEPSVCPPLGTGAANCFLIYSAPFLFHHIFQLPCPFSVAFSALSFICCFNYSFPLLPGSSHSQNLTEKATTSPPSCPL
jgi:hypothetical protein